MMNKIGLYLGSDPAAGGMFQYNLAVLDAVNDLPRDSFQVAAFASSDAWKPHLSKRGISHTSVHDGLSRRAFWKAGRMLRVPVSLGRKTGEIADPLARVFLAQKCDLWIFPSLDPLSFEIPVRSLASIHDLMHRYEPHFPEVSEKGTYQLREWCYGNMCAWAAGVLVDSAVGKQQVRESYGLPDERIHVLPYVAPAYLSDQAGPADVTAKYRLPGKYLWYPANFWEHKNHKNLVEAVGMLKSELQDLSLVLAGTRKNSYDAVMQQIRRLGLSNDITVLGYVPDEDMAGLYRHARALIMPTFFGPTNIPPLEAFAVGCPAAVSRIYGMPEQVGDAALLFDPLSVEEIAGCIRRLWTDDDLCATLVRRGAERSKAWGQRQFNERMHSIIRSVLGI